MSSYNLEIEKHVLSLMIQYPQTWADISDHIKENDFSKVHRPIFSVLKQQIELSPQIPSVTSIILSEKLKIYGVSLDSGVDAYDYFEALRLKPIKDSDAVSLAQELKKTSVKRELLQKCADLTKELSASKDLSFDYMTGLVEKTLTSVNTSFFKNDETTDLFGDLIEVIEERGNNPIDAEDLGYMGPFPSINETLGSLIFPGAFATVGSRTGGGKSSLGFFYNVWVAEKYNLPLLHLDAAEMTVPQLQKRAVCALSMGRVPLWAVHSGEWRKNKEWTDIIRGDVWPRVKKINIQFKNIGYMDPKSFISFIRRFYFNKVGRDNHLVIHWDYIKGSESTSKFTQEYQAIGHQVGDLKSLITEEITASVWTAVQNNRTGIYTGKSANQIQDSEESFSLSDRIIQQSTNGFVMRHKIPEELAAENNNFGNVKLQSVKTRELLGKQFEKALLPVRLPDGKMVKNYYNLLTKVFHYEDKGDLRFMMEKMGQGDMTGQPKDKTDGPI